MKKKNIIFDFGTVIIDWNPHYLYDEWFGDKEKAEWFLNNICTLEWNFEIDGGKPFRQACEELKAIYPEWAEEIDLYDKGWWRMLSRVDDKMAAFIRHLKDEGYSLYGLSNWSREKWEIVYPVSKVFHYLDGIVVSGLEKERKPFPPLYNILLNRYNLDPKDCIFIDDRQENIDTAIALGIDGILYESFEGVIEELAKRGIE
ncbi:MAG: HAD family phosphatase [Bacteroidales bacterium]|nr:HAD family phosphatase [Bacteroidales bacterium]